ncbi:MAG: hypothetical protein JW803_06525 [Endomicrobiales bacterium]|nr:hypothetical protein [Endomicrobiales bacterium]
MKNWKILAVSAVLIAGVIACTSKKDRLTSNTLTITVDPSTAQNVNAGETLSLSAICRSAKSDNVAINPVWSVVSDTADLGTFGSASGKTSVFTARTPGTGTIYASYGSVRGGVSVTVVSTTTSNGGGSTSASFTIFDDAFGADLDIISPPSDKVNVFVVAGCALTPGEDTSTYYQGTKSWKSQFTVTAAGWAGWYVGKNADYNMSSYSSGKIMFMYRSAYDLQIAIRSSNLNSDTHSAKIYLSEAGYTADGSTFKLASINISSFQLKEPSLDLTKMRDLFVVSAVGSKIGAQTNKEFWLDDIRWEK